MKYLHTMIRVSDPVATIAFFELLGLREVRRIENEKGRFTLIFLAADEDMAAPAERARAEVELTHNWDPEEYAGGRNFGHLAYRVEDIYATCQRLVDAGKKRIVGLNAYRSQEEAPIPLLKIDDRVEKQQVARTKEVRRKRSAKKALACLSALKEGSLTANVNLMPLLVDAAREYVTLGEMCDTLRETMGVYTDPAMF